MTVILFDLGSQLHGEAFRIGGGTPDVAEHTGLHALQAASIGTVIHHRDGDLVDLLTEEVIVVFRNCVIGKSQPAFFHGLELDFFLQEVNEMKLWKDIGFEIEVTGDGSPSLRLLEPTHELVPKGEVMHHSGGAAAETNQIYGKPIADIMARLSRPSFLIVGLGLGYIEMVIAREALKQGRGPETVARITSFESVPELREFFWKWLWGRDSELSPEVSATYDQVLKSVLKDHDLEETKVKAFLQFFFRKASDISEALAQPLTVTGDYNGILYDAFSSKTSPHLWEESFLTEFLGQVTNKDCVFSTYACRGSLKRALRHHDFEVVVREGFLGKRNSTLGLRGPGLK